MNKTIRTKLIAMLLVATMAIGLAACGSQSAGSPGAGAPGIITDPETGVVTEIPDPDANSKPWVDLGGWGDTINDKDGDKSPADSDGHVPGTPRESKPMSRWLQAYGELTTLVKSIKTPSKPDLKNTKMDNNYGTVDWSTAANGYITFTAKGQERCFILQGPNDKQTLCTVAKGDVIKIALIDGAGKYQYAIANKTNDGKAHTVQYKNSFSVSAIDSDLAPYLVSTAWGDYENAPNAVAKADELWDTSKTQLDNIKEITHYVTSTLHYDKTLKMGTIDAYVNPDKVIENGGGVCNELSKTLVAMLRSQGVPAYYTGGQNAKGQGHAWVMAWLEFSSETKSGTTKSTGTWILIEATGGGVQTKSTADKNYTPSNYAG